MSPSLSPRASLSLPLSLLNHRLRRLRHRACVNGVNYTPCKHRIKLMVTKLMVTSARQSFLPRQAHLKVVNLYPSGLQVPIRYHVHYDGLRIHCIHGEFVLSSDVSTLVQTCVVLPQTESRDFLLDLGLQRSTELSNRR